MVFGGVISGFIVFSVCLVMKRIVMHNIPTPPRIIRYIILLLIFNHVFVGQLIYRQTTADSVVDMIGALIGLGCYLYVVGDISYYRRVHAKRAQSARDSCVTEDHPEWPNYRQ